MSISFCSTLVFTLALLTQLAITPWLSPAMPPTKWAPYTLPVAVQPSTAPPERFCPTMPPTMDTPLDTPTKLQFFTVPALLPATLPTVRRLPSGMTRPCSVRFCTTASDSR